MLRKADVKFVDGEALAPTSSLNDYFMCVCGKKFTQKLSLTKHIKCCKGEHNFVTCEWCNLKFKNHGNWVYHAYRMHGIKTLRKSIGGKNQYNCNVCEDKIFTEKMGLRYHIREYHFNLCAKIPHAEAKKINRTWFENVLNTNLIVQIQKTAPNTLVMKPMPPSASIKIQKETKTLDLRSYFPVGRNQADELCKICLKIFRKRDLPKHMNEIHFNLTKHTCNNCQQTFKRSYVYLQHRCFKEREKISKPNGVIKNGSSKVKISRVESLEPVVVD